MWCAIKLGCDVKPRNTGWQNGWEVESQHSMCNCQEYGVMLRHHLRIKMGFVCGHTIHRWNINNYSFIGIGYLHIPNQRSNTHILSLSSLVGWCDSWICFLEYVRIAPFMVWNHSCGSSLYLLAFFLYKLWIRYAICRSYIWLSFSIEYIYVSVIDITHQEPVGFIQGNANIGWPSIRVICHFNKRKDRKSALFHWLNQ